MFNFTFHNPVRLVFGKGQIATLASQVPAGAKILMTYGGGSIFKNGVHEQVKKALAGFEVLEFGGIEPNPTYETLMKAVEIVRSEKVDFLLAVGGGSVLDGTKFIAAAAPFEGEPWTILTANAPIVRAVPLGAVLTLPATGSEMNTNAVISRTSTQEKLAFSSAQVFPKFSVVDPETTYSLPPRQIANGVVDAFVHVMEQYCTYLNAAPLQDRLAESILQTLVEDGPKTLANPTDYDTRASVVWCATMALNGLIGQGVAQDWATHMIGHELTAFYGLDHAQTLAIVLPNLLDVQREEKREKLLQFAERVWGVKDGSAEERIDAGIAKMRAFFETMGNPTHLSAYGFGDGHFEALVDRLSLRGSLPLGERKSLDAARLREILARAK